MITFLIKIYIIRRNKNKLAKNYNVLVKNYNVLYVLFITYNI